MGGFGNLGGSESSSLQRTTNQQQTASDQAVVVRAQGQAFREGDIKVGKGGTLTITNGLSREDAQALLSQSQVNPDSTQDDSFKEALLISLNQRQAANTDRAVDEAKSAAPSNVKKYLVWGIGAVVVIALLILFGRKSK